MRAGHGGAGHPGARDHTPLAHAGRTVRLPRGSLSVYVTVPAYAT